MGKVNYQHLKRLKETARKNRQQEKLNRRAPKEETVSTADATPEAQNGEEVSVVPGDAQP